MMTPRGHRRTAALLLVALLLSACGQPRETLRVGMREVANDIVLGGGRDAPSPGPASTSPAPPPVPPTPVVIRPPAIVPPPAPPRFEPSPSPSPTPSPEDACPEDHPLDAPAHEARRDFATAPAEEELTYRNDGSFSLSGANANEGVFKDDTVRTVTDVTHDGDDFTFVVVAPLGGTTTATTYRAVNTPPTPEVGGVLDQAGLDDLRGLYLVRTVTEGPEGDVTSFRPVPELLLLPFPSSTGDTFSAAGTDPISGVSMSYSATIGDTMRVNACGTPLQGIQVTLDNGRIVGPGQDVEFSARYVFATQFGGLSIEEEFIIAGTEAGATSSRENLAIINVVPTFGPDMANDATAQSNGGAS